MTAPLGWLQLKHKPLRLLVALAGIGFAVLLILMQLGFRAALFESAVRFHERFDYDIALFSPDSVFIVQGTMTIPSQRCEPEAIVASIRLSRWCWIDPLRGTDP